MPDRATPGRLPDADVAMAVDAQRCRLGRAYRAGRLICGCMHVTISLDDRLGLTQHERRVVRARFHEPLDDELRGELNQLLRRRGAAAGRIAANLEAIEIALEDQGGGRQCIVGHVQPPQMRHGRLRDIEFDFGLTRAR